MTKNKIEELMRNPDKLDFGEPVKTMSEILRPIGILFRAKPKISKWARKRKKRQEALKNESN